MYLTEFSLGKVGDVVREELTDDGAIKTELYELQLRLELGDIDEETYAAEEARLVQWLREVREWREHYGMGVSGGVVRVAGTEGDAGDVVAYDSPAIIEFRADDVPGVPADHDRVPPEAGP